MRRAGRVKAALSAENENFAEKMRKLQKNSKFF
jgi:hypothetical protein